MQEASGNLCWVLLRLVWHQQAEDTTATQEIHWLQRDCKEGTMHSQELQLKGHGLLGAILHKSTPGKSGGTASRQTKKKPSYNTGSDMALDSPELCTTDKLTVRQEG